MRRRKLLAGVGSLAAGTAAAMSTGAFTSVTAERTATAKVTDDWDALLTMWAMDTHNGRKYARMRDGDDTGGARVIEFDLTGDAGGLNDEATTVIRDVFGVANSGSRSVYVWAEGLPEGLELFTDDTTYTNHGTGAGQNNGAFSDTAGVDPTDPSGKNGEAAPLLGPGESASSIGFRVTSSLDDGVTDTTFRIVARAESEIS